MPRILQPTFGGGEIDPELWGRQDLARFASSARLLNGWIVKPAGGLERSPGTVFVGAVASNLDTPPMSAAVRFLKFEISSELAYLVVANNGVFQFVYRGAFVMDGPNRVEVAHPYSDDQLAALNYTQSADTSFVAHNAHMIRLLRRTSATTFTLSTMLPREGPFRSANSNQALKLAASGKTGTVNVEANFDFFTSDMVGALIYLEPDSLGRIKPWVQGERTPSLTIGSVRRSDGKVYRATTVTVPGGAGAFCETGNVRPIHEVGREWDGPGDTRSFSGTNYNVGVEWEYMHSGYGIVEVTAVVDDRNATCVVRRTLPDEVVGGVGTPASTWSFSGNGTVGPYTITGATSTSQANYSVEIDGVPVQPDPNFRPPGSGWTGNDNDGGSGPLP